MDPISMIMMALPTVLSALNVGGSNASTSSTYNKSQKQGIEGILDMLKGMKGQSDINQNPQFQQGQEWLSSLFNDPEFFKNFEAPLMRQFEEDIIPGLSNRFASMGSGGALGSTGFRNQLAREGGNLSTNIAALRGGMQQQGVNQGLQYAQQPFNNMLNLYNTALGHPTENVYQPASNPFAPVAGATVGGFSQGYGQQFGKNMANRFPGQNALTD